MIRGASSRRIPCPKKAGDEPTPPKFPQPRTILVTETPLRPSSRVSTRAILGGTRSVRAERGSCEGRRDLDRVTLRNGRRDRVEDLDDVGSMGPGRPLWSSGADGTAQVVQCAPPVGPPERVLDGDGPVRLAEGSQLDRRVELLPVGEEDRARVAVELDAVPVRDARNVEVRGQTYDRSALELEDCDP